MVVKYYVLQSFLYVWKGVVALCLILTWGGFLSVLFSGFFFIGVYEFHVTGFIPDSELFHVGWVWMVAGLFAVSSLYVMPEEIKE